jgi:hypothetical protein
MVPSAQRGSHEVDRAISDPVSTRMLRAERLQETTLVGGTARRLAGAVPTEERVPELEVVGETYGQHGSASCNAVCDTRREGRLRKRRQMPTVVPRDVVDAACHTGSW